jgi:hypothetical protein
MAPFFKNRGRFVDIGIQNYLDRFFTLVDSGFLGLPNETMFANNLYAPGTPSGNSRKNDKPVYT